MTVDHHPLDETLLAYAGGSLDKARSLVVAAHLETCAPCRAWDARLQQLAGAMLADLAPAELAPEARERVLARAFGASLPSRAAVPAQDVKPTAEPGLPRCLAGLELGTWRWLGPGVHKRAIHLREPSAARLFLLRVAPGRELPHHTHSGTELTQILAGAFRHAGGRFGPGDCDDADDSVEHRPVVEAGEPCLCLVAMEGNLMLKGPLGRLLQPFVRL